MSYFLQYFIKLLNPSEPGIRNNKGDVIFRGGISDDPYKSQYTNPKDGKWWEKHRKEVIIFTSDEQSEKNVQL